MKNRKLTIVMLAAAATAYVLYRRKQNPDHDRRQASALETASRLRAVMETASPSAGKTKPMSNSEKVKFNERNN